MPTQYPLSDFLSARSASSPSFSLSGKTIAFLSNQNGNTNQLYVSDIDGSNPTQITDYPDGIVFILFSKISEHELYFGKHINGNEKTQINRINVKTRHVTNLTKDSNAKHAWGGISNDGNKIVYASNGRNGRDFDIFIQDIASGDRECIYDDGGYMSSGGFSPSDRCISITRANTNFEHVLYLYDTITKTLSQISPLGNRAKYGTPKWLEDESGFYLSSDISGEFSSLYFVDMLTRSFKVVIDSPWDIYSVSISPDYSTLITKTNEDGFAKIRFYAVTGATLSLQEQHILPEGNISSISWSRNSKKIALTRSDYNQNANIWIWDKTSNVSNQITHANMIIPTEVFVKPDLIHYPSFDELSIPAYVYTPENLTQPSPAIVHIHGGPESQFSGGYVPLIQYFVHRNYVVIAPNIRGSNGYGKTYLSLDDKDKRLDSITDLEYLHDWATNDCRIDQTRMALMGGSYGGYMVLAGLAFQPTLWAAGVDIVGISNLITFLENTSPYRRALREAEYGTLKDDRDFLVKASPINKAADIKAPLLIIHGANDPRVPLSEAQQIHNVLQTRGVASELLVYEDEGHGLSKLKNRLDAYSKIAEFLDRSFKL